MVVSLHQILISSDTNIPEKHIHQKIYMMWGREVTSFPFIDCGSQNVNKAKSQKEKALITKVKKKKSPNTLY